MKYKNWILFVIITFLRSVCIAMLKFFLRSYLKESNISLETIAGFISLGGFVAYFIASPLTYAFKKKHLDIAACGIAIVCLVIGHLIGYFPFWVFALLISGIGLAYSLWNIIKSIILSIEIQQSDRGEAKINGIINIAILGGILLGSYLGFTVFGARGEQGIYSIFGLLLTAMILSKYMNYDQNFEPAPLVDTFKKSRKNIRDITKKYIRLLLPIGALRAISTAIGQKMLELGIDVFIRTPKSSILIIVAGFGGAIIGNFMSIFFKRRRRILAMLFTIIFGLTTIYFPHIIQQYDFFITLHIFACSVGIFFGIAVNLLEGRYFFHIGEDKTKEYGSVAYGIITSGIIFLIMIGADYLSKKLGMEICFFFFGLVLLSMPFLLRKFDASDISKPM